MALNNIEVAKKYVKQYLLPDGTDEEVEEKAYELEDEGITSEILKYYVYDKEQCPINVVNDPMQCLEYLHSDVSLDYNPSEFKLDNFCGEVLIESINSKEGGGSLTLSKSNFTQDTSSKDPKARHAHLDAISDFYEKKANRVFRTLFKSGIEDSRGYFKSNTDVENIFYKDGDKLVKLVRGAKLNPKHIRDLNRQGVIPVFHRCATITSQFIGGFSESSYPRIISDKEMSFYMNLIKNGVNRYGTKISELGEFENYSGCKIAVTDEIEIYNNAGRIKSALKDIFVAISTRPMISVTNSRGNVESFNTYNIDDDILERLVFAGEPPYTVKLRWPNYNDYVAESKEDLIAFLEQYTQFEDDMWDLGQVIDEWDNDISSLYALVAYLFKRAPNFYRKFKEELIFSQSDLDKFAAEFHEVLGDIQSQEYWSKQIIPPVPYIDKKDQNIPLDNMIYVLKRNFMGPESLDKNIRDSVEIPELAEHYIKWRKRSTAAGSQGLSEEEFRAMCEEEYVLLLEYGILDPDVTFDKAYPSYMWTKNYSEE